MVLFVVAFCVRLSSLLAVHYATVPGEFVENAIGYKWYASAEAFAEIEAFQDFSAEDKTEPDLEDY